MVSLVLVSMENGTVVFVMTDIPTFLLRIGMTFAGMQKVEADVLYLKDAKLSQNN